MNERGIAVKSNWKRYVYRLVAAEISTVTRFSDVCVHVSPLPHDAGYLFDSIECPRKEIAGSPEDVVPSVHASDCRDVGLLNGNLNYCLDIQGLLSRIRMAHSRHSRLFVVVYNPFMGALYAIASRLGIREAPVPTVFVTEQVLRNLAGLSGYCVERIRPCVFLPFYIPVIAALVNRLFPAIPLLRRLALLWVVVLRPVARSEQRPSLSIIVPARNEAGNIPDIVRRLPAFGGAQIELIFVEGHSTDDTWARIEDEVARKQSKIAVRGYRQSGKGKNDAVRLGFANASGELVTILDADMTMPPERLELFYNAYREGLGDFVNGSRLVYPMEQSAMRPLNRVGNILFAKLLARLLDLRITDSLCGTKLLALRDYHRLVAWRRRFGDIDPFGDFELLFAAAELVLGVVDVPIQYRARSYGSTNIQRFRDGFRLARMAVIGFFRIKLGKVS